MKNFCILLALFAVVTQTCFSFEIPLDDKKPKSVSLALDESGNVTAALLTEKNKKYFVEVTTSRDGGCTWETPTILSSNRSPYSKPALAVDKNSGRAIIVWEENAGKVMISQSLNNGEPWSTKKFLSLTKIGFSVSPNTPVPILLSSGQALICREANGTIELINSSDFGQSWSSTKFSIEDIAIAVGGSISDYYHIYSKPKVQFFENGTGLVLFQFENALNVALSTTDFGKNWKLIPALPEPKNSFSLRLNMNAEGKIICTWNTSEGMYFSYYDENNKWTYPTFLTGTEFTCPTPKINIAPTGEGFFIYDVNNESHIVLTTKNHGKTWIINGKLDIPSFPYNFLTAMSDNGDCTLVWATCIGERDFIRTAYSSNFGREWSEPSTISNASQTLDPMKVCMNSHGQAVVLWYKHDDIKGNLCGAFSDDFGQTWQD